MRLDFDFIELPLIFKVKIYKMSNIQYSRGFLFTLRVYKSICEHGILFACVFFWFEVSIVVVMLFSSMAM